MPRYLISRDVPGAGRLSDAELAAMADKSNSVLAQMDGHIQWDHSYVTDDRLHCVYIADDESLIRTHAECGGFPCNEIRRVGSVIDPTTGGA